MCLTLAKRNWVSHEGTFTRNVPKYSLLHKSGQGQPATWARTLAQHALLVQSKQTAHSSNQQRTRFTQHLAVSDQSFRLLKMPQAAKGSFPLLFFCFPFDRVSCSSGCPELLLVPLCLPSARMADTQHTCQSSFPVFCRSGKTTESLCSSDVLEATLVSVSSKLFLLIVLYYFLFWGGGT